MTTKKYHSSVLLFVTALALLLALATTFAWFSSRFITKDFTFTTAKLGSSVTVFLGTDFDHDGYLDLKKINGVDAETFDPVPSQLIDGNTVTIIELSDILPSEIYTFKFNVYNSGDVAGDVLAVFSYSDDTSNEAKLFLKTLAVTPVIIHADNTMTIGQKLYFADETVNTAQDPTTDLSVDVVNQITLDKDRLPTGRTDRYSALSGTADYSTVESLTSQTFVFRLEMVPYDELTKKFGEDFMTETQYNQLQLTNNKTYSLLFSVILEAQDFQYDAAQDNTNNNSNNNSSEEQN